MNPSYYAGPIKVSLWYFALYYVFLFAQSFSCTLLYKYTDDAVIDGKKMSYAEYKYDKRKKSTKKLVFDRAAGNTMEQALPFLVSLWLMAIFVSPESATSLGWYYLGFRSIYPICFAKGNLWLDISTVPGYFIIGYMLYSVYSAAQ